MGVVPTLRNFDIATPPSTMSMLSLPQPPINGHPPKFTPFLKGGDRGEVEMLLFPLSMGWKNKERIIFRSGMTVLFNLWTLDFGLQP